MKSYSSAPQGFGEEIARRSGILNSAGLKTPAGTYDAEAKGVRLPWIEGTTGRAMFEGRRPVTNPNYLGQEDEVVEAALQTLASLHVLDLPGHGLAPFDPWRRIAPRLEAPKKQLPAITVAVRRRAEMLVPALRVQLMCANQDHAGRADTIVHGDFHLGQIIIETATDECWMIDLDDLAVGSPEVDLANFAAHFVTSKDLYQGPIGWGISVFCERLSQMYGNIAMSQPNPVLVTAHGAVALVRRALKLSESGEPDERTIAILETASALVP